MQTTAPPTPLSQQPRARRLAWIVAIGIFAVVGASAAIPMRIIHPFRPQTAAGISLAYRAHSVGRIAAPLAALLLAILTVWLWRGARSWRKPVLVSMTLLVCGSTWMSRQHPFEWMFDPNRNPAYSSTASVQMIGDAEDVMVVANNGEAVAYPVRFMAYHHILTDSVGGRPITVTY